jgi:hypothetical protein
MASREEEMKAHSTLKPMEVVFVLVDGLSAFAWHAGVH